MTNSVPGLADAIEAVESSAGGLASDILSAVAVILFAFIGLTVCFLVRRLLRKGSSGALFRF